MNLALVLLIAWLVFILPISPLHQRLTVLYSDKLKNYTEIRNNSRQQNFTISTMVPVFQKLELLVTRCHCPQFYHFLFVPNVCRGNPCEGYWTIKFAGEKSELSYALEWRIYPQGTSKHTRWASIPPRPQIAFAVSCHVLLQMKFHANVFYGIDIIVFGSVSLCEICYSCIYII